MVDLDARNAALRAGYSPATAGNATVNILRREKVRAAIDAEMDARAVRTRLTADRVVTELMRLAFFDPRRLFAPDGGPLPVPALDADVAAALTALEVHERDGERVFRCRTADKLRALDLLARHLGMYRPALPETPESGVILLPETAEEWETGEMENEK